MRIFDVEIMKFSFKYKLFVMSQEKGSQFTHILKGAA